MLINLRLEWDNHDNHHVRARLLSGIVDHYVFEDRMRNITFSLGIISLGLVLGYLIRLFVQKRIVHLPLDIETLRKWLQRIAILILDPIVYLGAVWIIDFTKLKIIVLPLIGILALLLGGSLALVLACWLKMSRKQTGAYIVSGGFTNIGLIGAFICFTFLGEAGFALASFYKLFELFVYYTLGFPIAKSYSDGVVGLDSFQKRVRIIFADPFVLLTSFSFLAGVVLNVSGAKRPDFFTNITGVFIPTATVLLLASIGMAMNFTNARKYIKEALGIASIKFAIVPTVMVTISYLLGLGNIDNGLPLKVVLILSSMPVGFTALVPPTIYDLDVDLVNASWIVTNLALLLVVPGLQFLIAFF